MTRDDIPRPTQPATPPAALVVQASSWRPFQADPPLSMGILKPIKAVDFYRPARFPVINNAPLPRDLGSKTNQG